MTRRAAWVALAMAGILLVSTPGAGSAHPLGNFSINHYAEVRVGVDRIGLDLVVDMAEVPTLTEIPALDANGDGAVSGEELESLRVDRCRDLASAIRLTADGRRLAIDVTEAGLDLRPGAAGLDTLRTSCGASARLAAPITGTTRITFRDGSWDERVGWREVVVSGDGVRVSAPAALTTSRSDRLLAYPADRLDAPLAIREVAIEASPGGSALPPLDLADAHPVSGASAQGVPSDVPGSGDALTDALGDLVRRSDQSPLVLGLALLLALAIGAGHALSPGHGKAMMAASLVGSRRRSRDAVLLGVVITVSHTVGVIGLAAVILLAGRFMPPERLYPILAGVAGVAVLSIGVWMLASRIAASTRKASNDGQGHSHAHPHAHPHPHPHPHSASEEARAGRTATAVDRGTLLGLGLAGGLVPSASAVVLLLGAVAAGRPLLGFGLAVAFGIGMALVLCSIGVGVARVGSRLGRAERLAPLAARVSPAVAWATPIVIISAGAVFLGQAWTGGV